MADEAEWNEAEAGIAAPGAGVAPPAPGGGEETKRKRGRPKGSLDTYKRRRRRRRTGDLVSAVPAASLGDMGHSCGCIPAPPLPPPCTVYTVRDGGVAITPQSMEDEVEGVEAESGNAGAASAARDGEETKRKRGSPEGSLNERNKDRTPKPKAKGRRRRRTDDQTLSVSAVSLGDLGLGVAAGTRSIRERRPAPNAFLDVGSDSDTEVSRFCSSLHIRRAMDHACSGRSSLHPLSGRQASYALRLCLLFFFVLNGKQYSTITLPICFLYFIQKKMQYR